MPESRALRIAACAVLLLAPLMAPILAPPAAADGATSTNIRLPSARIGASAIADRNDVYVFGGFNGTSFLDDIVRFNVSSGQVATAGAKLATGGLGSTSAVWDPRDRPGAGCGGGCAYIFGGVQAGDRNYKDTILRYNPATDTLTTLAAKLPTPRMGTGAVWNGTHAFILGGCCGNLDGASDRNFRDVLVFDPVAGTSPVKSSAQIPSVSPGAYDSPTGFWDGRYLYVYGGSTRGEVVPYGIYRFDPRSDTAVNLNVSLPFTENFVSAAWDGRLAYFFGGCHAPSSTQPCQANTTGRVLVYAPATNAAVASGATLPTPRWGTAVAWVGNSAYVIAGSNGNSGTDVYYADVLRFSPDTSCAGPASVDLAGDAAVAAAAVGGNGTQADPFRLPGANISGAARAFALRNVTKAVLVTGLTVRNSGVGLCVVNSPSVTVEASALLGNAVGLNASASGGLVVRGSDLVGNGQAVLTNGGALNASGNFWGSSGPPGPSATSANVTVVSWRAESALATPPGNVAVEIHGTAGDAGYVRSAVCVEASLVGLAANASLTASLDGAAPIAVSGCVAVADDGSHNVSLYVDGALKRSVNLRIDATAPSTTAAAEVNFYVRADLNVTFVGPGACIRLTASDKVSGVASLWWALDPVSDGAFVSVQSAVCLPISVLLEAVTHRLCMVAVDVAGNVGADGGPAVSAQGLLQASRCARVQRDTTAPNEVFAQPVPGSLSVDTAEAPEGYLVYHDPVHLLFGLLPSAVPTGAVQAQLDDAYLAGKVLVRVTADDAPGVGVGSVRLYLDNALVGIDLSAPYEFVLDAGAATAGPHVLSATATDLLGNARTQRLEVFVVSPNDLTRIMPALPVPSCVGVSSAVPPLPSPLPSLPRQACVPLVPVG